ncbi:hypothetical protein AL544_019185 [Vibrio mimicus]|uniref:Uncharacterized protein n=1 Tax=Vibrio mimicus TaxID=674 RepID=A0A1D8SC17_VIBMI|nr:hypothetical protein AL543_15085 [Vibrio mimicus]AOW82855.1 hypothetical protein VM_09080 [Vibrio mimicus]ERM58590.1 hypothetical protein P780_05625 [Vibrio mimicus CAIM 1882]ERM59433.1 hypothetical protein P781_05640 [Vibrio mimicus CAIM 1883]PNM58019.1 hypothetical protein AL544_019185 [Vibrio mimicus]
MNSNLAFNLLKFHLNDKTLTFFDSSLIHQCLMMSNHESGVDFMASVAANMRAVALELIRRYRFI